MLYLSRKIGESIIINDNIELKVIDVKGKTIKLGFEFPPSATILRKEIHDNVVAENVAAAQGGDFSGEDLFAAISKMKKDISDKKNTEEEGASEE